MKFSWLTSVIPIALLFSFRMLGLFMLIPVFTLYAGQLTGATPQWIGIALGCYGLSQGILQIPFGMLSDRWGRKGVITLGLLLFALGSVWGALTTSIQGMAMARTLQGMGAIGSVLIALLADLTPDETRTKAMAVIGMSIGLSFSISLIISPAITQQFGLAGIFYLTAILAGFGLVLLHGVIPTPKKEPFMLVQEVRLRQFISVFTNKHLQRLNAGIFCQHFILTATFFTLPLLLQQQLNAGHLRQQWHFYLPVMVGAFLMILPFLVVSERKSKVKPVFVFFVLLTSVCQCILAFWHQVWLALYSFIFLYFVGFNFLEASLPSLISKQASSHNKGTAMGVYSSCQFLGIFAGGIAAGWIYPVFGTAGLFGINSSVAFLWFIVALFMKPLMYDLTLVIPLKKHIITSVLHQQVLALPGVIDAVVIAEEDALYLRVHKDTYDSTRLQALLNHAGEEYN